MIFTIPTEITFGKNCLEKFSINETYKKVLILTSKTFKNNEYLKTTIIKYFQDNSTLIQFLIIPSGEPTTDSIDYVYKKIDNDIEAIIAIGGGSVLDTAKFLSTLFFSLKSSLEYDFNKTEINKALPLYLIPTTAGSGSEVTPYSVVSNSKTGRKFTISSQLFLSKQSFVDSSFLRNLSRKILVASSLDAFIHSLEVLLNKNENILLENLAISSMENIFKILSKDLTRLKDEDYELLSLSSLYGGICIANSRTGLIHTFSVAFSEYSKEAHGILNSKILKKVLEFNLSALNGKLAIIMSKVLNKQIIDDEEALHIIEKFINNLLDQGKIIFENEPSLEYISSRVMQDKGLVDVNLKEFSNEDLIKIAGEIAWQE